MVLTALAVRPGEALTADQLAELLWPALRPASWAKVVQGCVVRLRKTLGRGSIETSASGYRLTVPRDEIDAQRFERATERARALLGSAEDPERAAHVIGDALRLWRGEALVELDGWHTGRIEADRLSELRHEAEELFVEAHLRAGHSEDVVARAQAMVREQPLRERRWALLALAQYQAGRQGDALTTLRRVRSVLGRELGLDPGPDLAALEQAVLRQDPGLLELSVPVEASLECPYRGLLPYDTDDASLFFGRSTDVDACLGRLGSTGVLAVVGASGTGKSSLVRAGVVPSLRRDGRQVVVMSPGEHPMTSLSLLPRYAAAATVVVDQLEEVSSLCRDADERTRFLDGLVQHTRTGWLVVVLRADHLVAVSTHRALAGLLEQGLHLMAPMGADDLRAAIEEPARLAGLTVEPGLVQLLVHEVTSNPGSLPMMSHALQETWQRREGRTLTLAGYQATGGIQEAVARSAEQVYTEVGEEQQSRLRDLMLRLVAPGTGGEPVRTRLPRRLVVTDRAHGEMVDLLAGSRLVTTDDGVVEIAHEALTRAWPRLRDWLDEDVEGGQILHHLATAADSWDRLGHPDSELYRGARLARVLDWRARAVPDLSDVERAFLDAGERLSLTELRAAEERTARQRQVNRRLRGLLATGAVLLAAALVAGLVAVRQADRAARSADAADARRLGARALASKDVAESLLLGVEGVRLDDSPQTRANLFEVISRRPQLLRSTMVGGAQLTDLDVSRDGRSVFAYDLLGNVTVVDPRTGAVRARHQAEKGPVPFSGMAALALSPTGDTLAVGRPAFRNPPVVLLDADTLKASRIQPDGQPTRPTRTVGVAFSADGTTLAASFRHMRGTPDNSQFTDASVVVWDLRKPRQPPRRIEMTAPPQYSAVALSPDGRRLFTSMPLAAYDVATGEQVFRSPAHVSYLVKVSPDGRRLAIADVGRDSHLAGTDILLADARTGAVQQRLSGHTEQVYDLEFSPDGRMLASTSDDGTAVVWDLATGKPSQRLQLDEPATLAAFDPTGHLLYTGGVDRALRTWDLLGKQRFLAAVKPARSFDFGFVNPAPGGAMIAYDTAKGLRFLDVHARTYTPLGDTGSGYEHAGGAWTPDGKRFASAQGGLVRVWDPRTGRVVDQARPVGSRISEIDYSTDGSRLVVAEVSGRVTLLDADTLQPVGRPVDLGDYACCVSAGPDNRTAVVLLGGAWQSEDFASPSDRWATVDLVSGRVLRQGRLAVGGNWVSVSPKGHRAAVGGGRGEVLLLNLDTGAAVRPPVIGHDDGTNLVVFSPDGSRFVSAGFDGTVSLWDGRTGAQLAHVESPARRPASAEFLPGGRDLLIATYDRGVYRWDTSIDHAVAFACRMAGRNLTRNEWADAFGRQTYRPTCPGGT